MKSVTSEPSRYTAKCVKTYQYGDGQWIALMLYENFENIPLVILFNMKITQNIVLEFLDGGTLSFM